MSGGASPMPSSSTSAEQITTSAEQIATSAERAVQPSTRACSPKVQFTVSVLQLITQAVFFAIIGHLVASQNALERSLGYVALLLNATYGYVWMTLYGGSLTRRRRASFFEANILKTYQPRARSHGHLFQPDPPTPVPADQRTAFTATDNPLNGPKQSQSQFNLLRDQHYANEFNYVQRTAKEMDEMQKNGKSTPKSAENIKVEGPVMIEFKEKAEEEDDEDLNMGSYRQDL